MINKVVGSKFLGCDWCDDFFVNQCVISAFVISISWSVNDCSALSLSPSLSLSLSFCSFYGTFDCPWWGENSFSFQCGLLTGRGYMAVEQDYQGSPESIVPLHCMTAPRALKAGCCWALASFSAAAGWAALNVSIQNAPSPMKNKYPPTPIPPCPPLPLSTHVPLCSFFTGILFLFSVLLCGQNNFCKKKKQKRKKKSCLKDIVRLNCVWHSGPE